VNYQEPPAARTENHVRSLEQVIQTSTIGTSRSNNSRIRESEEWCQELAGTQFLSGTGHCTSVGRIQTRPKRWTHSQTTSVNPPVICERVAPVGAQAALKVNPRDVVIRINRASGRRSQIVSGPEKARSELPKIHEKRLNRAGAHHDVVQFQITVPEAHGSGVFQFVRKRLPPAAKGQ